MGWITALWLVLRAAVASRAALVAENLALQHQLVVYGNRAANSERLQTRYDQPF